jgi:hypothetical protein
MVLILFVEILPEDESILPDSPGRQFETRFGGFLKSGILKFFAVHSSDIIAFFLLAGGTTLISLWW